MVSHPVPYQPDGRRYSSRQCPPYLSYSHHPHHPSNQNQRDSSISSSSNNSSSAAPHTVTSSTLATSNSSSSVALRLRSPPPLPHGQHYYPPGYPPQSRRASSVTSSVAGYLASHDPRAVMGNMAETVDNEPQQRKRIAVACGRCRKRKIRCSGDPGGGAPCSNCKNAGYEPCLFLRVASAEASMRAHNDIGSDFEYNVSAARAYAGRSSMAGSHPTSLTYADINSGGDISSMYGTRPYPYASGASASRYYPTSAVPGYSTAYTNSSPADYDSTYGLQMGGYRARQGSSYYNVDPSDAGVYGYGHGHGPAPTTAITLAHRPAASSSPHHHGHASTSPADTTAPYGFVSGHVQHERMLPQPGSARTMSTSSGSSGSVRSPVTPSGSSVSAMSEARYGDGYSSSSYASGGQPGFGLSAETRASIMNNGGQGELDSYAYRQPGDEEGSSYGASTYAPGLPAPQPRERVSSYPAAVPAEGYRMAHRTR